MTRQNSHLRLPDCDPSLVNFDARSRQGARAARRSVQTALLSMYLGSVVSMTFVLAARQLF